MAFKLKVLDDAARGAGHAIATVKQQGQAQVDKALADIRDIFGAGSACLARIRDIGEAMARRQLEADTAIIQAILEVLPFDILEQALSQLGASLERDPTPQLHRLVNPVDALWHNQPPDIRPVSPTQFQSRRNLVLLVHGMGYGNPDQVYDIFVKHFELCFELFKPGAQAPDDLYFVSWNSDIFAEDRTKILTVLSSVLDVPVAGISSAIVASLIFREMERRAHLVSLYLDPFAAQWDVADDWLHYVFSHSFGSLVWSDTIGRQLTSGTVRPGLIGYWLSMQAAVLYGSYEPGALFNPALRAYQAGNGVRTTVFHSYLDAVLSTAYLFAKHGPAVGQIGSGTAALPQLDVTQWTGEAHGETEFIPGTGGYFARLARAIHGSDLQRLRDYVTQVHHHFGTVH